MGVLFSKPGQNEAIQSDNHVEKPEQNEAIQSDNHVEKPEQNEVAQSVTSVEESITVLFDEDKSSESSIDEEEAATLKALDEKYAKLMIDIEAKKPKQDKVVRRRDAVLDDPTNSNIMREFILMSFKDLTRVLHCRSFMENVLSYGCKMSGTLLKNDFVVSPFLSYTVLTTCFLGANKKTASELADVLNYRRHTKITHWFKQTFNSLEQEHKALKISNKMFIHRDYKLNHAFEMSIRKHFPLTDIEFVDSINDEKVINFLNETNEQTTNEQTKHQTERNVVNKLKMCPQTSLRIVNVFHFDAEWSNKFQSFWTHNKPFWVNEKTSIAVPTMIRSSFERCATLDELDARVLELSYKNSDITMMFFLPNQRETCMETFMQELSQKDLYGIEARLRDVKTILNLPKFKLDCVIDEKSALTQMGIQSAFDPQSANFDRMHDGGKPLWIADITQKASIEVGEHGTNFSAINDTDDLKPPKDRVGSSQTPKLFIVNHPFVFILRLGKIPLLQGVVTHQNLKVDDVSPNNEEA